MIPNTLPTSSSSDLEVVGAVLFICLLFQIKHYLCDFILQNKYMLGKFNEKGWEKPLIAHVGVHGLTTMFLSFLLTVDIVLSVGLALLDMILHFVIDRWKVVQSRGLTPYVPKFWILIGADQYAHHLTHYLIILLLFLFN